MNAAITMPRMGETMEEGRIAAWLKKPGEAFKRGEIILEIETDKTIVEAPALADGTLTEILAEEGATVGVGAPIGRYRPTGAAAVAQAAEGEAIVAKKAGERAAPVAASAFAPQTSRLRATPVARRLARVHDIDLATVAGTGRRNRIERKDVEAASGRMLPAATVSVAAPNFVDLPAGRMAYRDWSPAGARRTVLFLHGFGGDGETWSGFLSGLARANVRAIAPDLPSHGATAFDAADIETVVSAVADFVAALGLAEYEIVAHSMGAAVAARATAGGKLRPSLLTLVAPAGLGSEIDADFITGVAEVTSGGALSHLLRRLSGRSSPLSRAQCEAMAAVFAQGRLKPLARALVDGARQGVDILPDLRALTAPCRVIWGTGDAIAPWTQIARLPSRIAIHLIAGAGHMPTWDNPQDFASLFD